MFVFDVQPPVIGNNTDIKLFRITYNITYVVQINNERLMKHFKLVQSEVFYLNILLLLKHFILHVRGKQI